MSYNEPRKLDKKTFGVFIMSAQKRNSTILLNIIVIIFKYI